MPFLVMKSIALADRLKKKDSWDIYVDQVVGFEELADTEEQDRLRRDAYERVNYLLDQLGIRQQD